MNQVLRRLSRIFNKIPMQLRHLASDPESFGRTVLQFTNTKLFEKRLIDRLSVDPIHVERCDAKQSNVRLNILSTSWTKSGMTGGPNTVIALAFVLLQRGIDIRFVTTVEASTIDSVWLVQHGSALLGERVARGVDIAHAGDPGQPLPIGDRDLFLATHWTTAKQLEPALAAARVKTFIYMIQDFEAGFYAWSSNYAGAIETYGMDFHPVINERLLAEYVFSQPFGRLQTDSMRNRALVFEPAVDREKFFPRLLVPGALPPKRLLFYGRPTNPRNLFGLALAALRDASRDESFVGWEFVAIGSRGSIPEMQLSNGHTLRVAGWSEYTSYGDMLRSASILLCPMLSPHTSYPVLEMAACGGWVVTNTFQNKTKQALQEISMSIVAVEPTLSGFSGGLISSARLVNSGQTDLSDIASPQTWREAFEPVVDRLAATMSEMAAPLPQ